MQPTGSQPLSLTRTRKRSSRSSSKPGVEGRQPLSDACSGCQHPHPRDPREARPAVAEKYAAKGVRFYAPDAAFADAEKYLPDLLRKRGKPTDDLAAALSYLRTLVEPLSGDTFAGFEAAARQRLRGRDEEDWPILAAALSLACGIWTEDTDFFGAGIAVWTTDRVELYLSSSTESAVAGDE